MARLVIFGSAAAVSDAEHDNTHFLLQGDYGSNILVDCGSNPLVKLRRCAVHPGALTDMILTHFHPDHVAGVPILLMQMWLLHHQRTLNVYGLHHCVCRVERMMQSFLWDTWPDFFPVVFHPVSEQPAQPVLENEDFRITSWPTRHFIPTIGLRIEVKTSGRIVAYSGDTEPTPDIVQLACGANLLLHEAAGGSAGHSSAAQAGQTAAAAGVQQLELIHYRVGDSDPHRLVDEAQTTFTGPVALAEDLKEYEL
jgi:ribonuclease Z